MKNVLLCIKDVKKTFQLKRKVIEALKGVSFDLYKGEILGLLGANGAGKTTLSTILATLNPPTSGDILLDGCSIYKNIESYRSMLGYCPQRPNVNKKLTVKEQLLFSGHFYGLEKEEVYKRVDEVIEQFNLQEYVDQKPEVLSGGYKQRVMIARTLIHRPQLIIFDEPTVGLDPHIRRQIWDLISGLKQVGVTIILTTHYLDEAEVLADRVCVLDRGRIKLIESPSELKRLHDRKTLEEVFVKLMNEETVQD